MYIKRIFLFSLLFIPFFSLAQTAMIEQLRQNFYASATKETQLRTLLSLCAQQQSLNQDSLSKYAQLARKLATDQKNKQYKSQADIAMIYSYFREEKMDSALDLIETALVENPVTDPNLRSSYFELAAQKADYFGDASKYKEALQLLYNIVDQAEQFKDSVVLAKNMNTIAVINYNIDDVPDAFNWYFKGIGYTTEEAKFYAVKGALFINIADAYRWVDKLDSAEWYIDKAIPLCENAENLFYLSNALRVKSSVYKDLQRFPEAQQTMLQAINISEKISGNKLFSNERLALAQLYRNTGDITKAIDLLRQALTADSINHKKNAGSYDRLRIEYYNSLAKCYEVTGDQTNLTATLKSIISEKDKFYEANSAQAIAELKTKYELQKKESTIIKQQLDLTQKNNLLYGSLIILFFAIIVAFLLFKNYRRKEELKTEQLLYREKVYSLDAVKSAEEKERKRIAADLHDNLGAYAASIASNLDQIVLQQQETKNLTAFQELRNNSKAIVSQLGDTIWALNTDELSLTVISDRIKIFMQRLAPSYSDVNMETVENIQTDIILPALQAFHLMRIIQEAINNALKHSKCKSLTINISCDYQWKIIVSDDGVGFDPEAIGNTGYGLYNMKNRAAEFGWTLQWRKLDLGTAVIISPTTN